MIGEEWFAWRPVRLVNGRWAWLRTVFRRRVWNHKLGAGNRIWWEYDL